MPVCDVYRLQELVDGQLSVSDAQAVAAHVEQCPRCARSLRELRCVASGVQPAPALPPADLHERLLAAVAGLQPLAALDCATALEFASLRLDEELSHEQAQRLAAHLDACAACALAVSEMDLTANLLREIEPEAAPLGLLQEIQAAAAAAVHKPAKPAIAWRRWAPSLAGMAAAAALVLALLTNLPQSSPVAPMVAQTPLTQTAAPAVSSRPTTPPAPTVVAAVPTHTSPLDNLRRAALAFTAPVAAPPPARVALSAPPVPTRPSSPAPAPTLVAPTRVAPSPEAPTEVHPAPTVVAMAPTRSDDALPPRESITTPPARVQTSDTPPARAVEPPAPVRVATIETPAPAPPVETPRPARHTRYVSRVAAEERDIYTGDGPHLADARRELEIDARLIRDQEVKGFVIR